MDHLVEKGTHKFQSLDMWRGSTSQISPTDDPGVQKEVIYTELGGSAVFTKVCYSVPSCSFEMLNICLTINHHKRNYSKKG